VEERIVCLSTAQRDLPQKQWWKYNLYLYSPVSLKPKFRNSKVIERQDIMRGRLTEGSMCMSHCAADAYNPAQDWHQASVSFQQS
jgi:hypothetical protein